MHSAGNGSAQGPDTSVILKLIPVPKNGAIKVRFLGEWMSTLTHWVKGNPGYGVLCRGSECHPTLHKTKQFWKAYAPIEVWREAHQDWYPGVTELSSALGQQLGDRRLTGEMWELQRLIGDFKHAEIVGVYLGVDRPAPIDARAWVETVCFRLYHTREIQWHADDPLPTRVRLETRKAPPPPRPEGRIPTGIPKEESQPQLSIKEMLRQAREAKKID